MQSLFWDGFIYFCNADFAHLFEDDIIYSRKKFNLKRIYGMSVSVTYGSNELT